VARHLEDALPTADGLRLAGRGWLPADAPRGSVLLLHGLGEHVGRYVRLAGALAAAGFGVYGYDQRGHGSSPGPRARLRALDVLVDDVRAAVQHLRERHAGPWSLLGHSTGGTIALRAVQCGAVTPDALVLSSPYLRPRDGPPPAVERALVGLGRVAPWLPASRLDPAAMSRDPTEVEAYRSDPANYHGFVELGTAAAIVTGGRAALSPTAPPLRLPTLVLHGSHDRIADPAAAMELARRNPGVTLHIEPEGRHELFNDTCREFVTSELLRWLPVRLERAG
jgi:acylglycerol lipase